MNINLIRNNDAPSVQEHENVLIEQMDEIPPNACVSLILNQTLQYLTKDQLQALLTKVRHNGMINISTLDILQLSAALYHGHINAETFSSMVEDTKTQYTLLDTKAFFEQQGYVVQTDGTQDFSFYIRAQRP